MHDTINDKEIQAYLDQQLTPENAKKFQARLKNNPAAQKKLVEYQKIEASLKGLYQPVYEEMIPPHLLNTCKQKPFNYLAIAASILFFVVGALSGWQIENFSTPHGDSLAIDLESPAMFAHSVYSVEKLHPVEVGADKKQHMNNWLSKRLKTQIKAPDLRQYQFELVGGRLLPSTKERMAAQYMYQNKKGERVTLYIKRGVWPQKETAINHSSKMLRNNSFNASFWTDGSLGYVITSQLEQQINQELSETIYQQMSLNKAQYVAVR